MDRGTFPTNKNRPEKIQQGCFRRMKGVPLTFPGIANTLPVVKVLPLLPELLDGFQMREVEEEEEEEGEGV